MARHRAGGRWVSHKFGSLGKYESESLKLTVINAPEVLDGKGRKTCSSGFPFWGPGLNLAGANLLFVSGFGDSVQSLEFLPVVFPRLDRVCTLAQRRHAYDFVHLGPWRWMEVLHRKHLGGS